MYMGLAASNKTVHDYDSNHMLILTMVSTVM